MLRHVRLVIAGSGMREIVVVFLCAAALFVPTARPEASSTDVVSAELSAWRIGTTGHPWLDGVNTDSLGWGDADRIFAWTADNGHVVTFRSPGVVAAGVPAYALAGGGSDIDSFSGRAGGVTAALLAAAAVALLFGAVRNVASRRTALLAAGLVGLATPVWSVAADGLWTHSVTIVGLSGMAWAVARNRWWIAGVAGGVALTGRLHVAVIVAVVGLGLSLTRRDARIAIRMGVASGAFVGLCSVWTHWVYGSWFPTGGYVGAGGSLGIGGIEQLVNQAGLWVSPLRGILVWTPVALVLLPSLVAAWRRGLLPDWSRLLLWGGVAYTIVQGALIDFSGGDSFYGYRLALELLVTATPAFALAARYARRRTLLVAGALGGLQFAAILPGVLTTNFALAQDRAWTGNEFVSTLLLHPGLTVFVVIIVACATLGARIQLGPPADGGRPGALVCAASAIQLSQPTNVVGSSATRSPGCACGPLAQSMPSENADSRSWRE